MSLISLSFVSPAVVCLCSLALGWDHCLAGVNRDANILSDGAHQVQRSCRSNVALGNRR